MTNMPPIKIGDLLPSIVVYRPDPSNGNRPVAVPTDDFFKTGNSSLFLMPSAFSPTCSGKHLTSVKDQLEPLLAKGKVIVMVSDSTFAAAAWIEQMGLKDKDVIILCDVDHGFARATGLKFSRDGFGHDLLKRAALRVENGKVTYCGVEETPPTCTVSSAQSILEAPALTPAPSTAQIAAHMGEGRPSA
jgi:cytochrome c peroxidase